MPAPVFLYMKVIIDNTIDEPIGQLNYPMTRHKLEKNNHWMPLRAPLKVGTAPYAFVMGRRLLGRFT